MARIAGVNIPQNKLVYIGLTYIFGIGDKFSGQICKDLVCLLLCDRQLFLLRLCSFVRMR